jgi:hypothetical protein
MTDTDDGVPLRRAPRSIASKLRRLTHLKERKSAIENEIEVVQAELDRMLGSGPIAFPGRAGREFQATVVRGSTETVDLEYWRKNDGDLFTLITKPVLDKEAFIRLYEAGRITDEQVKESVLSKPKKSYVLITPISQTEE